jgi:hypothetical protein
MKGRASTPRAMTTMGTRKMGLATPRPTMRMTATRTMKNTEPVMLQGSPVPRGA